MGAVYKSWSVKLIPREAEVHRSVSREARWMHADRSGLHTQVAHVYSMFVRSYVYTTYFFIASNERPCFTKLPETE